jgi:hypothetical protein
VFGNNQVQDVNQGSLTIRLQLSISLFRIFMKEENSPILVSRMRTIRKHKLRQHAMVLQHPALAVSFVVGRTWDTEIAILTARHQIWEQDIETPS